MEAAAAGQVPWDCYEPLSVLIQFLSWALIHYPECLGWGKFLSQQLMVP